jgi:hypothetical protein
MGQGFDWIGSVVAGFCAAFLAYVAMGGALSLVVAEPYNVDVSCWPHYTVFGMVRTECANSVADAVWHATAEDARSCIVAPTLALVQFAQVVRTGSTYWLHDALSWGTYALPVLVACTIGFFHMRMRSPALAWVLLVLVVGQIAVGVAPHITRELVEPMD